MEVNSLDRRSVTGDDKLRCTYGSTKLFSFTSFLENASHSNGLEIV